MAKGLQLIRVAGQRPGDDVRQVLVLPAVLGAAKKVLQRRRATNEAAGAKNRAMLHSTVGHLKKPSFLTCGQCFSPNSKVVYLSNQYTCLESAISGIRLNWKVDKGCVPL